MGIISILIPVGIFYFLENWLLESGWNIELVKWSGILILIPFFIHLLYLLLLKAVFKIVIENKVITVFSLGGAKAYPIEVLKGYIHEVKKGSNWSKLYFFANDQQQTLLFTVNAKRLEEESDFIETIGLLVDPLLNPEGNAELTANEREREGYFAKAITPPQKREAELHFRSAKRSSRFLFALSLAMIFLTSTNIFPYLVILFPILLIYISAYFKGVIKIFRSVGGFFPYLLPALICSSSAVIIFIVSQFQIDYSFTFWIIFSLLSLGYLAVLLLTTKDHQLKDFGPLPTVFIALLAVMYSYGLVSTVNTKFDFSDTKNIRAEIKEIQQTDTNEYLITLAPFSTFKQSQMLTARSSFVRSVEEGEKIRVIVHKGVLNSSWYYKQDWLK